MSAGGRGSPTLSLPDELDSRRLRRRVLQVTALFVAIALLAWLAPGLDSIRSRLDHADPAWLLLGVALEVASCAGYVLMFGPIFCERMALRTSVEIGLAELGVGSLIPAGGLGGLALGVWALRRGGMPTDQVATRSVAFFLIKCAANFAAVAVVGVRACGSGVGTPSLSPALTILPAVLAVAVMVAVACAAARSSRVRAATGAWRGRRGRSGAA